MTTPTTGIAIERDLALRVAADRLAAEFDRIGRETIERFLDSSYEHVADGARIETFLPLMAERFARQRLRALARVEHEHDHGTPTVLFVCPDNAARSLMALALVEHLAGDGAVAWSAGARPAPGIDPAVVEAMAERGIDLSEEFPKPWTDEIVDAADVVVTMGGASCPVRRGARHESWPVWVPDGELSIDAARRVRDELEERIRDLLARLGVRDVSA
ncbi:three-helix bundle dimerization domain-containing protein [Jiangella gansuensis]|uniref:arsenate reductase/protein-tyrosine-phosphatase family protein n=1 Tax=Jiangella gansuensis TaxID=281473 RepID=UPI00047BFB88|nr:low molecular weight phosphatase family protein [Jiangella gansuensis]